MWPSGFEKVPFEEAIAFFREKLQLSDDDYEALSETAKARAFAVAGVAQLSLVADVWRELEKAIEQGTTLEAFKAKVQEKLEASWKGTVKNPAARVETIFRTNVQGAYSAGRHEQATDPDIIDGRPYWMFDAILDDRTTKTCRECDGTILPADDPWWQGHIPPLHFNCRSTIITLTPEQAREKGVSKKAPAARAAEGFGAPPTNEPYEPDEADFPPELWTEFEKKRG